MKDKTTKAKEAVKQTTNDVTTAGKRVAVFANATALAVVGGNAIKDVYPKLHDLDVWTVVLLVSGVLIGLTAFVAYFRFFANKD